MCGSIRQFSTLKMKKALTEILNGLWNKKKARRIFLEARLHLPTPASADGRDSRVPTPSTSGCHTSLEIYTRFLYNIICCCHKKKGTLKCTCLAGARREPQLKHPWKVTSEKLPRTLVPVLQTENMFVLRRCHPGSQGVACWWHPAVYKDQDGTWSARLWQLPPLPISSLG